MLANPCFMTKGCKRCSGPMDDDEDLPFNSCGEVCLAVLLCQHVCPEICHPGPCKKCQLCEQAIPGLALPRRHNFPRDSLELIRGGAPQVQSSIEQAVERTTEAFSARDRATSDLGPRTLRARIWIFRLIYLAIAVILGGGIFAVAKVIFQPHSH